MGRHIFLDIVFPVVDGNGAKPFDQLGFSRAGHGGIDRRPAGNGDLGGNMADPAHARVHQDRLPPTHIGAFHQAFPSG